MTASSTPTPTYPSEYNDGTLQNPPLTWPHSVVVATGLIALVDDCIKRRFHQKQSTQLHIPLIRNASFKMNMEYIGPKRLIDEVFHRTNRGGPPSRHVPASRQHPAES